MSFWKDYHNSYDVTEVKYVHGVSARQTQLMLMLGKLICFALISQLPSRDTLNLCECLEHSFTIDISFSL